MSVSTCARFAAVGPPSAAPHPAGLKAQADPSAIPEKLLSDLFLNKQQNFWLVARLATRHGGLAAITRNPIRCFDRAAFESGMLSASGDDCDDCRARAILRSHSSHGANSHASTSGQESRMALHPRRLELSGKREFSWPIPAFSSPVTGKLKIGRQRGAPCDRSNRLWRPCFGASGLSSEHRTSGGAFMSPRSSGNAARRAAASKRIVARQEQPHTAAPLTYIVFDIHHGAVNRPDHSRRTA